MDRIWDKYIIRGIFYLYSFYYLYFRDERILNFEDFIISLIDNYFLNLLSSYYNSKYSLE